MVFFLMEEAAHYNTHKHCVDLSGDKLFAFLLFSIPYIICFIMNFFFSATEYNLCLEAFQGSLLIQKAKFFLRFGNSNCTNLQT